MSIRKPTRPTATAIEEFDTHFDPLFKRLSQRENFRHYVSGLLVPIETNKHLRGLAAAVPEAEVEALQHFLVDAPWSLTTLNATRLALLQAHPETAWHGRGVLIIDETGEGCADVPFVRKIRIQPMYRVSILVVSARLTMV